MKHARKRVVEWVLDRLAEQSTWKGLVLLSGALGLRIRPDAIVAVTFTAFLAIGLINVLRSEKPKRKKRKKKDTVL